MFNKIYNLILEYPHYNIEEPVDLEIENIPIGDLNQLKKHLVNRLINVTDDLLDDIVEQILEDDTAIKAIQARFKISKKIIKYILLKIVKQLRQNKNNNII